MFRQKMFGYECVTSVQEDPRFGAWSLLLIAVWTLSPYLRGPLGPWISSHRQAAVVLGLILLLTLIGVLDSELAFDPRGAVIVHSS